MSDKKRFFQDRLYAAGYLSLSISSREEELVGGLIQEIIASQTSTRRSLMEIGMADGRVASRYANMFDRVTGFEPNPHLCNMLQHKMRGTFHNNAYSGNAVEGIKHNVIVACHVLYHIDQTEWPKLFQSFAERLERDGAIILVLWNAKAAAHEMTLAHSPDRWLVTAEHLLTPSATELYRQCGLEIAETRQITPTIRVHNPEAARGVLGFLLGNRETEEAMDILAADDRAKTLLRPEGLPNDQQAIILRHHL